MAKTIQKPLFGPVPRRESSGRQLEAEKALKSSVGALLYKVKKVAEFQTTLENLTTGLRSHIKIMEQQLLPELLKNLERYFSESGPSMSDSQSSMNVGELEELAPWTLDSLEEARALEKLSGNALSQSTTFPLNPQKPPLGNAGSGMPKPVGLRAMEERLLRSLESKGNCSKDLESARASFKPKI